MSHLLQRLPLRRHWDHHRSHRSEQMHRAWIVCICVYYVYVFSSNSLLWGSLLRKKRLAVYALAASPELVRRPVSALCIVSTLNPTLAVPPNIVGNVPAFCPPFVRLDRLSALCPPALCPPWLAASPHLSAMCPQCVARCPPESALAVAPNLVRTVSALCPLSPLVPRLQNFPAICLPCNSYCLVSFFEFARVVANATHACQQDHRTWDDDCVTQWLIDWLVGWLGWIGFGWLGWIGFG